MKSKLVISKLCRSISLNLFHGRVQKRISLTNSNHHHQRNGFYCFGRKVFLSGLSTFHSITSIIIIIIITAGDSDLH